MTHLATSNCTQNTLSTQSLMLLSTLIAMPLAMREKDRLNAVTDIRI